MAALNIGVYVTAMARGIARVKMLLTFAERIRQLDVITVRQMTIYIKGIPDFRWFVSASGIIARVDVMADGHAKNLSENTFVMKTAMFLRNARLATLMEIFFVVIHASFTREIVLSICVPVIARDAITVPVTTQETRVPEVTLMILSRHSLVTEVTPRIHTRELDPQGRHREHVYHVLQAEGRTEIWKNLSLSKDARNLHALASVMAITIVRHI